METLKEPVQITITLPVNAYFMSGVRDFTLSLIKNLTKFSEQWAYRFQSVVDELCNNAIEYGSAQKQTVKVIFNYIPGENEAIEVMVEDSGTGKVKRNAAELQQLVAERRKPNYSFLEMRGRGLAKIVAEWTDELEFTDIPGGGLRVRAKKYLHNLKLNQPFPGTIDDPKHVVIPV